MPALELETFRQGYEAMNAAYRSGDVNEFRPVLEETFDPDVVLQPGGVLPDSEQRPHRGYDGFLNFIANQMEAFSDMWIRPEEFIEVGDRLVVPHRMGGQARHTGIEVEFAFTHVFTVRDEKVVRLEVFESKAAALEAAQAPP
jgi:ketosteroid isomerase-like protein